MPWRTLLPKSRSPFASLLQVENDCRSSIREIRALMQAETSRAVSGACSHQTARSAGTSAAAQRSSAGAVSRPVSDSVIERSSTPRPPRSEHTQASLAPAGAASPPGTSAAPVSSPRHLPG